MQNTNDALWSPRNLCPLLYLLIELILFSWWRVPVIQTRSHLRFRPETVFSLACSALTLFFFLLQKSSKDASLSCAAEAQFEYLKPFKNERFWIVFFRERWKYGMVTGKTDAQTLEAGNIKPLTWWRPQRSLQIEARGTRRNSTSLEAAHFTQNAHFTIQIFEWFLSQVYFLKNKESWHYVEAFCYFFAIKNLRCTEVKTCHNKNYFYFFFYLFKAFIITAAQNDA